MSIPEPDAPDATPQSDPFLQILAEFARTELARLESAKKKLRDEVLPTLKSANVANIEAAYSGYGDSGAIDGIQYRDEAGTRVDRASLPGSTIEQLENVLYEFLPVGFENNDGGQGTLTIDMKAGKVTIAHQQNEVISHTSSQELFLQ
jgi:hypothetical protein